MTLIDDIRTSGEAIEHALHEGRLAFLGLLPDSDVLRAMVLVAEEARLVPGGLATLMAGDYDDDPAAFCRRMHTALFRAAQMHRAVELYPQLVGGTAVYPSCSQPGCTDTQVQLVGRRYWCAADLADQMCDALLAESTGSGDDDA